MELYTQNQKIIISSRELFEQFQKDLTDEGIDVIFWEDGLPDTVPFSEQPVLFLLDAEFVGKHSDTLRSLFIRNSMYIPLFIYISEDSAPDFTADDLNQYIYDILEVPVNKARFYRAVKGAFEQIILKTKNMLLNRELEVRKREFRELRDIGIALASEKDLDKLLKMILRKSREITQSDAGSLYLVEKKDGKGFLHFKLTQNDSLNLKFDEFTMPINPTSISGYVALKKSTLNIPDVYCIAGNAEYNFNKDFDEKCGYRTCSMLTVPLIDHKENIIGVLQLINKKSAFDIKLKTKEDFSNYVLPFSSQDERLLLSLGSQAAVSIENNILYQNIQNLFEGFVKASVTAIEARDPTTRGHSVRVANLTVGLAGVINRTNTGMFRNVRFNDDQVKEIRYASLLHDFGKVGVREHVLLKAKKLFPADLQLIVDRFKYLKKSTEVRLFQEKSEFLLKYGREKYKNDNPGIEEKYRRELALLDEYLQLIIQVNEPTVIESDSVDVLLKISQMSYTDDDDVECKLVTPEEFKALSIKRGSLTVEDRLEIESHVTHTFRFLQQVPWTKELKSIPNIAFAHHEKLNGDGYPRKIESKEIPIQSKMMTISDIYDALTAADRPYKKAVPVERALQILGFEVKDNHVDPDLLNLFIEAKVFNQAEKTG